VPHHGLKDKKGEKKSVDVHVGTSRARTRRVYFPGISKVDANPINAQQPGWVDKFSINVVKGEYFDITRTDHDAGWGQDLVLRCKARGDGKYTVAPDGERRVEEKVVEKPVEKPKVWESLEGTGLNGGIDSQGNIIACNPDGTMTRRNHDSKAWTKVDGAAVVVARGADGTTMCVNSAGDVYRLDGAWRKLPGAGAFVAVGSASQALLINKKGSIFKWSSGRNDWDALNGAAVTGSVASDGTVYVINQEQSIFRKHPTANDFVPVSGKAIHVAAISKNLVFATNANGNLLKSIDEGATWTTQEGSYRHIAGSPGHLIGVNTGNQLFHLPL